MSYEDTGAGKGTAASAGTRQNYPDKIPFEIVLKLQSESFYLQDVAYALSTVITVLSEAPGVSQHRGVSAADTLIHELTKSLSDHHQTLEDLEMARFGKGRAA